MKSKALLLLATVALFATAACNQKKDATPDNGITRSAVNTSHTTQVNSRLVPSGYSKSISLDTANRMISSYLQSVGFTNGIDSAVRSLAFDADTLRSYLSDPNITSLEFFLAHQQAYLNADISRFGKNIGMRPGALTVICVGIDNDGKVVRNSSNGVYEHAFPCPTACPVSAADGYLH